MGQSHTSKLVESRAEHFCENKNRIFLSAARDWKIFFKKINERDLEGGLLY